MKRYGFLPLFLLGLTVASFAQTPPARRPPTPTPRATPVAAAMSNQDIVKMVAAGLTDDVIIGAIRQAPKRNFDLTPDGLIALKQAKVSDAVIRRMQAPDASDLPTSEPPRVVESAPLSPTPEARAEITVPDGTELRLRMSKALSSASAKVDERVNLEVETDLAVNDITVIKKGAQAWGRISEAQPKKSFGRQGRLNFTIDYVKAVDGQNVRLRASKEAKGGESYGKAGVVTILAGPFGALVKGKDVEIPAGAEFTIYIDGDRTIKLGAAGS